MGLGVPEMLIFCDHGTECEVKEKLMYIFFKLAGSFCGLYWQQLLSLGIVSQNFVNISKFNCI